MILGTGIDLADLGRIERVYKKYGMRFVSKFLTALEIQNMPDNFLPYLAGRFAAKEAAVKALGTGFADGITATQIETVNAPCGKPDLRFLDKAREKALRLGVRRAHLSISHERSCAAAIVILED